MENENAMELNQETSALQPGEPHPAALLALNYLWHLSLSELEMLQESFSSTALAGNRTSEICSETLRRVMAGELVSDRYVLGLAWMVMSMRASSKNHQAFLRGINS